MGFGLERLLSPARARSWLLGLSFYRLEPLVRDTVFYAESKKWTATSALIFNAVQITNRPWAQRRAVAAKGDLGG
jgi:hypothetical protein